MTIYASARQTPDRLSGAYVINGQKYPRVSTILGVISKPGLEEWRRKVGIEEANRISNEAAEHGTALHRLLEGLDRNEPMIWPAGPTPTIEAYIRWKSATVARVLMVEQTVHHERHRYAGTLDRLYLLKDGARVIGDFKSGRSVDGTYRLQQMAYQEALESMGHGPIDGRLILHMPRTNPGELKIIEYDDEERDRRAWRACLRLWRWQERHKDDWRAFRRNGSR